MAAIAGDRRCRRRGLAGEGTRGGGQRRGARCDEASRLELALGDIRDVFAARKKNKVEPADEIPSAALVEALVAIEGRPWAEMGRSGKPLTQNKLARMLKPLGIAPEPIGPKTDRVRGYVLKAFTEAFDRYPSRYWGFQTVHPSTMR